MALETLDRPLRYFLCIAELGSLSKAADLLDQTQSSVSKQLAGLEATLGAPLFVRTGRGVVLTEMGARLHETLRPLYRDIDAAIDEARRHSHTHGTVRLASVHTLSYYFTAEVVARFASAHPQVNLALLGRSSPDVVALVDSGKADLGFVYDVAVDVGTVISEPLFQNEMALVTRRDKPSRPGAPLRLVGFPPNYALRRMLHSSGIEATYVAEAETVDTMLQLVASGVGDCILPSRIPAQRLAEYALCQQPLESPPLRRWVVAIRRADRPLPALAQRFLACAMQVASGLRRDEKE
ncbi:LysR family transcriptional regulator [Bordetella trematum]|uniref:LysR family transcriptional regulator n=1 Tax=Bordetella trematum TaxID=123899 RepID=UPI000D818620|nr:LysR family transcriptional regulator [Bordetella trematum]SPU49692.1 LysR family transcriptional regulator [Bordetella trematum]VDH07445.1 HTH-type transcriptional regulator gltC [Bordetella trematum]